MTTTIQQTGKAWKGLRAIGCLSCLGGITVIATGLGLSQTDAPRVIAWGMGGLMLGLPVYVVARIGGWWFHG